MHILITNDDGITAPGLLALAQSLKTLGRISVLAPDHNWSASGHVKTLNRPLRVNEEVLADGTPALSSDGAPSDCVALAMLGVLGEKIDLVVSGINAGNNLGSDMTYSGTVTAAMEGAIFGIPSIAVSLDVQSGQRIVDYSPAAAVAHQVARLVLANGLPNKTLLNVNVPALPLEQIKGFDVTHLGLRIYQDELVCREDPKGRPYYWIGGLPPTGVIADETDFGAIANGYVSITPIQMDMTNYTLIDSLKSWLWEK
jgi:5'-nucleotidase